MVEDEKRKPLAWKINQDPQLVVSSCDPLDRNRWLLKGYFQTKAGTATDWLNQLRQAQRDQLPVFLEFNSPATGNIIKASIVDAQSSPNQIPHEILRGYPADTINITVSLTAEQIWTIIPDINPTETS